MDPHSAFRVFACAKAKIALIYFREILNASCLLIEATRTFPENSDESKTAKGRLEATLP